MVWKNKLATQENWAGKITNLEEKNKVAKQISSLLKDGEVIGVGSGSTSYLALKAISERVKEEGMEIVAIPTSQEALLNCSALGVNTTTLSAARPDWAFDGADEVDSNKRLIKGRGGAMFAEKLVMASAPKTYILVDESKFVDRLGEQFPVPVEVDPRAIHLVETKINDFAVEEVQLRMAESKDGPVITEAGNLILDVRFSAIPEDMDSRLSSIPGVVETGLFFGYSVEILTV